MISFSSHLEAFSRNHHRSSHSAYLPAPPFNMGQPSFEASNAIVYLTYGAFLVMGTGVAWKFRSQSKGEFLAGNRTQTG